MDSFSMDSFNLNKLKEFIPKEMPRLPSFSLPHSSMNPDDEDDGTALTSTANQLGRTQSIPEEAPMQLTDPSPIQPGPKSNLDLMNECDNFPYYQNNPKLFFAHINTYYGLYVKDFPETELGYILPSVAELFRGLPDWKIDDEDRSLTLIAGNTEEERSRIVAGTCEAMRATGHFKVLNGWRNELYPVYGPDKKLLFSIERAASALFGVVTYGCHLTAYTTSPGSGEDKKQEVKIWVPRRAATKQTYGGMLDNTVAGGIATGESPFESMVRECGEEASLPADLVREKTKSAGTVTYFHIRDSRAGGETRLLQPECQYVYDLELPENVIPKPSDDEVEGFELKTVDEVKQALQDGEFKPNCAVVLLDFFVRHGILTAEEENFIEIVARLHRKFEFPTL